jgi:hypothetical protein
MSQLATLDTFDPALPAWVVPATPEPEMMTVGINAAGTLYIYGETSQRPGPDCPAIIGTPVGYDIILHGKASKYGIRPYLNVVLLTPINSLIVLSLPCKESLNEKTGKLQTPWSVRSLLGALVSLDMQDRAVKLQTKRGDEATFFRVFPIDESGIEFPEVRATAIGPSTDDLEIAVNRLRRGLGQPPLPEHDEQSS